MMDFADDKPLPEAIANRIACLLDDDDCVTFGVLHATATGARVDVQATRGEVVIRVEPRYDTWEPYGPADGRGVVVLEKGQGGCMKPDGFYPDLYEVGFQHMRRRAGV